MDEKSNEKNLLELSEQMVRLRFSMDSGFTSALFREMSIADYLILSNLARRMKIHEPEAKVYLSEISKELELPISRVSRMVQNLQNKGYVYWEHDSKGTYIYLSEIGHNVMKGQQELLATFFGNVIEQMGQDAFVSCLDQMNLLEQAIQAEADRLIGELDAAEEGDKS